MRNSLYGAILGAAILLGCPAGEIRPVDIVLDEDGCSVCFMAVSQKKFAAETVTRDGQVEYYDDIGCLADRVQNRGLPPDSRSFVIDYNSSEWVDAATAYYLLSADLPTPMSYGLAAFAAVDDAEELGGQYPGRLLDWQQLIEEFDP